MSIRNTFRHKTNRPSMPPTLVGTDAIAPRRVLPVSDLLLLESLIAIGVVGMLPLWGHTWYAAAAGLSVAVLFVVRTRGASLPRWALRGLGFWRARRKRKNESPLSDPFDAEQLDGTRIGFQWDGKT